MNFIDHLFGQLYLKLKTNWLPVYYAFFLELDWELALRAEFLSVFVHNSFDLMVPYIMQIWASYCRIWLQSSNFFQFLCKTVKFLQARI